MNCYSAASHPTTFTNAAGTYVQYAYDNIGQLEVATSSIGSEDTGYAYDGAWNLNWLTNSSGTTGFTVNSRDELTRVAGSPCTYDANGNLTQLGDAVSVGIVQFTYDDENRLTQVATNYNSAPEGPLIGQSVTNWKSIFVYDGLSRLRKRSEYGDGVLQTVTTYIYDGFRVIQERDGSNNPQVSYTRGTDLSSTLEGAGGIGGLLARSSGYSSGNPTSHAYYHADGNGNITCLLDSGQNIVATYRYDAYGNTISSNGTLAAANVYRFSSKECHVNSGMYYHGYRFYSPNLQRWLNRDPIGEAGGINLYEFVGNDPVDYFDQFGLDRIVGWYAGQPIIIKDNPVPGQNPFPPDGRENIGNMIGAEYGKGLAQMAAGEAAGAALGAGARALAQTAKCKNLAQPLLKGAEAARAALGKGPFANPGAPLTPEMIAALRQNAAAAQKTLELAQQGINAAGNPITAEQAQTAIQAMQARLNNIQQTIQSGVQAPKN